jgi:PAS domain S-box-containing protein
MHTTYLIREKNQAEQAARESEQRYKRLLASVTDYVYSVRVGRGGPSATAHGPGCEAVTGYSSQEFDTDPFLWYRMIYREDRAAVTAQTERILQGQTPPPLEHRIVHKNGRIRCIRNTAVPHKDESGRLISYDGLVSDITERKRAEQFLAVQYAVTRELGEASTLDEALMRILEGLCTTFQCFLWDVATFWSVDAKANVLRCGHTWHPASAPVEEFASASRRFTLASGISLPGQVWASGEPAWIADLLEVETNCPRAPYARKVGLHGTCAFPVRSGRTIVGVIELFSRQIQPPDPEVMQVLMAAGTQIGQFLERKRAELALWQSQERLALVIQGSSDGIWDWDLTTNEVYFSPRWKSMLGYADHELQNHYSAWERLLHPADRERALACLHSYLSGQTPTYELEHRLRHKDGSYRWILARGAAQRDAQGEPVRMAGSHVDLTERKQAEEQLEQAYAELSQNEAALKATLQKLQNANAELQATQLQLIQAAKLESVGTLAAGVAHEVKNPLQTIVMGLDYLDRNLPGGNSHDTQLVLGDMRDAVTRANTIVRELLQLSAAKDFEPTAADLNSVVERSLWLINNEMMASQINVVRKLDAELPPVRLDRNKVQQVLLNLFINALQAMSQGGQLTVVTRHRRFGEDLKLKGPAFAQFQPGDPVVIAEVQDSGRGIPEEHLPRIFEPFFTTKPTGIGTGLGLSVVKKIMDLHGGAIDIRNAPLGGVVVTLLFAAEPGSTLPREQPTAGARPAEPAPPRTSANHEESKDEQRKETHPGRG